MDSSCCQSILPANFPGNRVEGAWYPTISELLHFLCLFYCYSIDQVSVGGYHFSLTDWLAGWLMENCHGLFAVSLRFSLIMKAMASIPRNRHTSSLLPRTDDIACRTDAMILVLCNSKFEFEMKKADKCMLFVFSTEWLIYENVPETQTKFSWIFRHGTTYSWCNLMDPLW